MRLDEVVTDKSVKLFRREKWKKCDAINRNFVRHELAKNSRGKEVWTNAQDTIKLSLRDMVASDWTVAKSIEKRD